MGLFWRHLVAQWLDSQHTALRATKVKGQSGQRARDPEPGCQAFGWEAPSAGGELAHKPQVLVQIPLKESLQVAKKVQERGMWALRLPPTTTTLPRTPKQPQTATCCFLPEGHSQLWHLGRNKRASHRERKWSSILPWPGLGQHSLSELQDPLSQRCLVGSFTVKCELCPFL